MYVYALLMYAISCPAHCNRIEVKYANVLFI